VSAEAPKGLCRRYAKPLEPYLSPFFQPKLAISPGKTSPSFSLRKQRLDQSFPKSFHVIAMDKQSFALKVRPSGDTTAGNLTGRFQIA